VTADDGHDRGTFAIAGVAVLVVLCCAGVPVLAAGMGGLSAVALGGAAGAAIVVIALVATVLSLRRRPGRPPGQDGSDT
jgi:hypothetical protein